MKRLFAVLFLLIALQSVSQTIEKYYDYNWKECDVSAARFYSLAKKTDLGWHRQDLFINLNQLQMDGYYEDKECKIRNGNFHYFYANGKLQYQGNYAKDKKEGLWLSYHYNGMMSDSSNYWNGNKIGTCIGWHANGYIADSIVLDSSGKGVYVSWFDNGNPSIAGRYSEGQKKDGRWKYFHKNGQVSDIETYREGKLIEKQYFGEDGAIVKDTTTQEVEASFKGGIKAWQKYLFKHLYFPSQFKIVNADKAVVVVDFVVTEEGNIENVFVSTPFYPEFDKIALEVITKSPKWIPALQNNRHVKYWARQAVIFSQEEY